MKQILIIPIILLALCFNACNQNKAWVPFTSTEGHYSINFPAAPKESVEHDTTSGNITTVHFAEYDISDSSLLMSAWTDLSSQLDSAKDITMTQLLENSKEGATSSMGATDIITTATNLKGDPYIEFIFSTKGLKAKDRVYIINKIQYSVISIFPSKKGIGPEADKFIHSFKHIL